MRAAATMEMHPRDWNEREDEGEGESKRERGDKVEAYERKGERELMCRFLTVTCHARKAVDIARAIGRWIRIVFLDYLIYPFLHSCLITCLDIDIGA